LGELVYGLHVPESKRALQRRAVDRDSVVEPKKPWALSSCSIRKVAFVRKVAGNAMPKGQHRGSP
jgi:hypothetical protein